MTFVPNSALLRTIVGGHATAVNLDTDTIKVMLVKSTYTPDRDHEFVDSITGGSHELSGTGYVAGFGGAGRKTLANTTIAKDNTNDRVIFDADDVTWSAINAGTARYAVVIREITDDAASLILAVHDLNPTAGILFNGNDWVLAWPTTGVIKWTSP